MYPYRFYKLDGTSEMRSLKKMPYQECRRYRSCKVNLCPLDPHKKVRKNYPGEPRCTLSKVALKELKTKWKKELANGI